MQHAALEEFSLRVITWGQQDMRTAAGLVPEPLDLARPAFHR